MSFRGFLTALITSLALLGAAGCSLAQEAAIALPAPAVDSPPEPGRLQNAVLAGGCFWGMQAVFEHVRGVREVVAGYSGGSRRTAQYQDVETGATGHAESVQVTFDPSELSYGQLLQIYFSVAHDPTQIDRQGPDTGTQYRSVVFSANEAQRKVAESYIAQLDKTGVFGRPIATHVDELKGFYRAEDYHQDYYLKNPAAPYIVYNDLPKISNLKRLFPDRYVGSPATVAAR